MVVFDSTFLAVFLHPDAGRANDSSGLPIPQLQERLAYLIQRLEKAKVRIVIPTPVLSEILVYAGASGPKIVETLTRSTVFKVMPFDELAAVEAALMTRAALNQGDKRGGVAATWAKVKFDRQIVAIAKVAKVSMIYSDDHDVHAHAATENIPTTSLAELPIRPEKAQAELDLASSATQEQLDLKVGRPEESEELADEHDIDPPEETQEQGAG
jgi:hypothetical protein